MVHGPGLSILFIGSTALTVILLHRAAPRNRSLIWILLGWLLLQGILAWQGFFLETSGLPPRMLLAIGPPLLCLVILMILPSSRNWLRRFDLRALTLLHIVRIPVE